MPKTVERSEKSAKKTASKKVEEVEETVQATETTEATETKSSKSSEDYKFTVQFKLLQEQAKTLRNAVQQLTNGLNKLEAAYSHDFRKLNKRKPKRNGEHKATGFAKPQAVPEKLAKFIGVAPNTMLSGPEITRKVWAQLRERKLTYEKDKRVFRTDKEVTEVFGVKKDVNKSTDHKDKEGFNFCNLQRYISKALKQ